MWSGKWGRSRVVNFEFMTGIKKMALWILNVALAFEVIQALMSQKYERHFISR